VSVLVALALMTNVLVYVVVQFYSLAQLLPLLSGELVNPRVVVFFIAAIIFVCEITGGFEAVVRTDNLQSGIMIIALVTIPIL
jgi:Na+/proline symporter